jgi:hypothetical protein
MHDLTGTRVRLGPTCGVIVPSGGRRTQDGRVWVRFGNAETPVQVPTRLLVPVSDLPPNQPGPLRGI